MDSNTESKDELHALQLYADNMLNFFRVVADNGVERAPTEESRKVWVEYKTLLSTYVIPDIINPKVPNPPRLDRNGVVISTSAPGSTPDVTG